MRLQADIMLVEAGPLLKCVIPRVANSRATAELAFHWLGFSVRTGAWPSDRDAAALGELRGQASVWPLKLRYSVLCIVCVWGKSIESAILDVALARATPASLCRFLLVLLFARCVLLRGDSSGL